MLSRIPLSAALWLALVGYASSAGGEVICAGEAGPVLRFGASPAYRLALAQGGREREMVLERWGICFRCAALPSLRLDLKGADDAPLEVRVGSGAQPCDDAASAARKSNAERYCVGSASVWIGDQQAQHCRFPEGTTLGHLWSALTHTAPPDKIDTWWSLRP